MAGSKDEGGASDGGVPEQQRVNHDSSIGKLQIGKQRNQAAAPPFARENDLFALPPQGRKPGYKTRKGGEIAASSAA